MTCVWSFSATLRHKGHYYQKIMERGVLLVLPLFL